MNIAPRTCDHPKPKLKLTGVDGNAFMIMGLARRALKICTTCQTAYSEQIKIEGMQYDDLLALTMEYCKVN